MEKDNIELPPLPAGTPSPMIYGAYYCASDMRDYALAAIKSDRQQRGEPVAYAVFADNGNIRIWQHEPLEWPEAVPLYTAPKPAEPVVKESLTVAEPVNNDRRMLLELMEAFDIETWQCPRCGHAEDTATMDSANTLRNYLQRSRSAEPVKVPSVAEIMEAVESYGDACRQPNITAAEQEIRLRGIRALLARYGLPVEPEGWRLVPIEPTQEMFEEAMRFQAAIVSEFGNGPHHDEIYRAMLTADPKFGEEK